MTQKRKSIEYFHFFPKIKRKDRYFMTKWHYSQEPSDSEEQYSEFFFRLKHEHDLQATNHNMQNAETLINEYIFKMCISFEEVDDMFIRIIKQFRRCGGHFMLNWQISDLNSIFYASNSNFQTKVNQMSCKILVKFSPHEKGFTIYISHALYAFIENILVPIYAFQWSGQFIAYHMFRGRTELKIKQNISRNVPGN